MTESLLTPAQYGFDLLFYLEANLEQQEPHCTARNHAVSAENIVMQNELQMTRTGQAKLWLQS